MSEYRFNPDLNPDAEIAAMESAHTFVSEFSDGLYRDAGRELTFDERVMLQDMMAPGLAHFYTLAGLAGELANQGDIVGAISLMGGIDNARELIGDENVDELLAELDNPGSSSPDNLD